MNLVKSNWTKEDYQEYIKYLLTFKNEKGKAFGEKLIFTKYEIIGMKMPDMRSIVKQIKCGNYQSFLSLVGDKYYEEVVIEGFIISSLEDLKLMEDFLPKIDNWAICDSFCSKLKSVQKNPDEYFDYFLSFLKLKDEYYVRYGLIQLLTHYVSDEYVTRIFKEIDEIKEDKYYINMGIAWLLCECYIKVPEKTEKYLLKSKVNKFTFNKTISKIRESYRVSQEKKDYLITLKRK